MKGYPMKLTTSIIINESKNIPLNDESKGMSIGNHIDRNIERYISSMKKRVMENTTYPIEMLHGFNIEFTQIEKDEFVKCIHSINE